MENKVFVLVSLLIIILFTTTTFALITPEPNKSISYYLKVLNANLLGATGTATQTASGTSALPQAPLLTAECIEEILAKSPAKGNGKYFVQYGEEYGVDPAFALAVFRQETSLCNSDVTGVSDSIGCKNKSIGNITCTTNTCYKGFNTYSSWEEGIRAFYNQIKNGSYYLKAGNTTVETIYPKWANIAVSPIAPETQNVIDFTTQYREKAKTC